MKDRITYTAVVKLDTGYDVHVRPSDIRPGIPALCYIAAVNLTEEQARATAASLLGREFRYGSEDNLAVAHLYHGSTVIAEFT